MVARRSPDSPAKSPFAANAARVAVPAGTGILAARDREPVSSAGAEGAGAPVSGAAASPTRATAPSAIQSRYGTVSGCLTHAARQPATNGPIPSAPTFTAV